MNNKEILRHFSHVENLKFPKKALDAALKQPQEITPALLDCIQLSPVDLLKIYDQCEANGNNTIDFSWIFSTHLLAQFRCQEAFKPLLKFFTYEEPDMVDLAADDYITASLPAVLASVFDGDVDALFAVMHDENNDLYVRDAFLRASIILLLYGDLEKGDSYERYKNLLHQCIENRETDGEMITLWVSSIADLAEPDFRPVIDSAYAANLVDLSLLPYDSIDEIYQSPPVKGDRFFSKVDDSYQRLIDFSWFKEASEEEDHTADFYDEEDVVETLVREAPKVGRNDPCPCGSGKKYKKCCISLG